MSEFSEIFQQNTEHFNKIQEIIAKTYNEWQHCGSYLMSPPSLEYDPRMIGKQVNLFNSAKPAKRILEIGVHAGHSLLIMLLANPQSKIDCIDIPWFSHTEPCINYLNSAFNDRITFHKGNSLDVLPYINGPYDLVHIDGAHDINIITKEIEWFFNNNSIGTTLVLDDFRTTTGLAEYVTNCSKLKIVDVPECLHTNCVCNYV